MLAAGRALQGLLRILIRRMEGDEDLKIPKWLNILLIVLAIAYLVACSPNSFGSVLFFFLSVSPCRLFTVLSCAIG